MKKPFHYLTICAIFKNEAAFLQEWLEFHRVVGVEHFILYNNNSDDNFAEVLAPYIAQGRVTLLDWPLMRGQLAAYKHCLATWRKRSRWIAFIDIDEFLFAPDGTDLKDRLREYERYPAVAVNWVMFGSSGWKSSPTGFVIENYTKRGPLDVRLPRVRPGIMPDQKVPMMANTHVKSIVDPRRAKATQGNPHSFHYRWWRSAVDENRKKVPGAYSDTPSVSLLRINHYWCKSEEDFLAKAKRGRAASSFILNKEVFLARDQFLNGEEDKVILQFLEKVKDRISNSFRPDDQVGAK